MCPKNQYKKIHHLFWHELLLWHLELHKTFDLKHLQVVLAQPVLQLHLTQPCPFPIDKITQLVDNIPLRELVLAKG
jgi:hypothetical protein